MGKLKSALLGAPLPTSAHPKRACQDLLRQLPESPLVVLESPYRSLIDPVLELVRTFEIEHNKDRDHFCTVVLPVFVTRHRWENLLHNQTTIALRSALRAQGTRVVTTVGFDL